MKTLLKTLLVLLFLAAIVIVAVGSYADRLVKRGVEEGGTYALGVNTLLEGVELNLRGGKVGLTGLVIENPEGFSDPHVIEIQSAEVQVPLKNLMADVVEIELFALRGAKVVLNRNARGTNFEALLKNLDRFGSGAAKPTPEAESTSSKRFRIRELRLEDLSAHLDLGLSGKLEGAGVIDLELAPIVLNDLDSSGQGLSIPEIARRVVTALFESSIEAGGSQLPAELRAQLEDALGEAERRIESSLQDLEQRVEDVEKQVDDVLQGAGGPLGGQVDEALKEGSEKLEKGLGGLLGGGKSKGDG